MSDYTYTHGGNVYDESGLVNEKIIDFSANINPLGIREEVKEAVINSTAFSNIYPDTYSRELSLAIAEFEEADTSDIFVSNGASDIIFRLMYSVKPKKVLVTAPSFSDYQRAAEASGAEIIYHFLKAENDFLIDLSVADTIKDTYPDVVIICNPNNPTGNITEFSVMKKILDICRKLNIILLIDECFLDFSGEKEKYSLVPLLKNCKDYKNLIILKAFTKIFAIPGIRLGYAVTSNQRLISQMRFHGSDWAVSNIAQAAGCAALKNSVKYLADTAEFIKCEREFLSHELRKLNLEVYTSYANYLLFRSDDFQLCEKLYRDNILIRSCENYIGLGKKYYRTAVLSREKNIKLVDSIRRSLGEI